MADRFVQQGLRVDAIKEARRYFTGIDHMRHGQEAKLYTELDEGGLAPNAVRILVLPLDDAPEMSSVGAHSTTAASGTPHENVEARAGRPNCTL